MKQSSAAQVAQVDQQALLAAFFEAVPDAIVGVDAQGAIQLVNQHAERMFGYRRSELMGRLVEFLVPDSLQAVHYQQRLAAGVIRQARPMGTSLELYARRQDGSEFPVDIMFSATLPPVVPLVIVVVRDLSRYVRSRRQAEAELTEVQHRLLDSQESEWQRLVQELHDGPLQELHSLDFGLVALSRQLSAVQQAQLMEIRTALQKASRQLRTLCQDLRPPALPFFGLSAALHSCAENFQRLHPALRIGLNLANDEQRLPERTRLALYRVCQQALKNVAQHAEAQRVDLSLHLDTNQVVMTIEDDGRGFEVPPAWLDLARQGRYGLIGCQERIDAIGGRFEVTSHLGRGAKVQTTVALATQSSDQEIRESHGQNTRSTGG